jgi:hypothetical protein
MSEGACYQSKSARDMAIISLLKHAHRMFREASVIQNLDKLEHLYRNHEPKIEEFVPIFAELDPAFVDAFRISTCFENLFKAQLLKFGYVVHEIDGSKLKHLRQEQLKRPIGVPDVRRIEKSNWKRHGEFTIRCLKLNTLPLGTLIDGATKYPKSLRLSTQALKALNLIRKERNSVHLVVNNIKHLNRELIGSYGLLRILVNTRLVPLHNWALDQWDHTRNYSTLRLKEL